MNKIGLYLLHLTLMLLLGLPFTLVLGQTFNLDANLGVFWVVCFAISFATHNLVDRSLTHITEAP